MHVTQLRQLSALAVALSLGLGTAVALAQQVQPQAQPQVQPARPQVQPEQRQAQPAQPRAEQQPGQANRQAGQRGQGQRGQGQGRGAQVMAQWLLVDNQGEIALAKFAQEKSQNEEVKEFAKMMLQDHTDFIESLRDAAGDLNPPAGGRGQAGQDRPQRQAGQAQPGQPQPGQPQAQPGQPGQPQQGQAQQARPQQGQAAGQQAGGMGFDIVRIKHEIGQQCVESLKEKLSEKKGEEFDKCYMGHQVVAHMQMLDTLKVFKRHASGEMAQLINNGIQTTEDHLMHAENIMKKLEGGAAATTARRPGGDRERD